MVDLLKLRPSDASRVYAIGDIHGRFDLLKRMEESISEDMARRATRSALICYLGDYIDRVPQSAQVLEYLATVDDGMPRVFLAGNHEDRFLKFLDWPAEHGVSLIKHGGREAFASYGLFDRRFEDPDSISSAEWSKVRNDFISSLPCSHLRFLQELKVALRFERFLFVHAGVNPERPLTSQDEGDLMWIREPFLKSDRMWDFLVVHGHVVVEKPDFRQNRINIDTGAFRSGCLTCLVAENSTTDIIQVEA